ncbi:hypothetical protein GW17_00041586 [Ensete ventricosum]|nr:hypothetical protein GW17_00041586 [Ensete ventricosum]
MGSRTSTGREKISEPSTNRSAVAIVSPPRGRPAPRGEEAAALPPLKSLIAEEIAILTRLESPIAEATAILPHLNSPRTIVEEKLPSATPSSFGKERGCYPQHRSQAQVEHERKGKLSLYLGRSQQPSHETSRSHHSSSLTSLPYKFEFQLVFRAPSHKFKILVIPNVLAPWHKVTRKVKFRSVFHASSRKFKILAIPND